MADFLLKWFMKPRVESDIPGRLRLSFPKYHLLPKGAAPYLHHIETLYLMVPGVQSVRLTPQIGTMLITYDPEKTSRAQLLQWTDMVFLTGAELLRRLASLPPATEDQVIRLAQDMLAPRLEELVKQ